MERRPSFKSDRVELRRRAPQTRNGPAELRSAGLWWGWMRAARATGKPTWKRAADHADYDGAEYRFRACPRVPYRFPKTLKAEAVYLPEGEKDVHTLEAWGLVASCNPGGSGNSHLYAGWADYFRGQHIVILPDNDGPGRKHAAAVAAASK